ncbi:MAG: RNA polymerase sigma factor [Crocinitomicaceae bacterium]
MGKTIESQVLLISDLKNGDQKALAKLYDDYSPALYGLILKIIHNELVAQDILQECFVKIWKNAKQYDSKKGSFFTWMLNICRNKSIDFTRSQKRELKRNENAFVEGDIKHKTEINIDTVGLKDILLNLSEEKREIVDYLYFKGYTQQETSDELDIPLGTVKTRSRAAISELKDYFTLILALWISNNT